MHRKKNITSAILADLATNPICSTPCEPCNEKKHLLPKVISVHKIFKDFVAAIILLFTKNFVNKHNNCLLYIMYFLYGYFYVLRYLGFHILKSLKKDS